MMKVAYEHGINFFDNAEGYGGAGVSEIIMGEAIQLGLQRGVWERPDLVISTKIFTGGRGAKDTLNSVGLSRKHISEGLQASLKRMQLDYVDLVLCHRPDPRTPIEETVRGMNHVINKGMAFYWGTSEWSARQLQEARGIAKALGLVPPMFDQCQYSLIERQRVELEYEPLYPELGLTIWSPLAGGALSGKYNDGASDGRLSIAKDPNAGPMAQAWKKRLDLAVPVARALEPIAQELGCSVPQLAVAWAAANPRVSTVILGATRLEQLKDTLAATEVVGKLTPALMKRIDEASGTRPLEDTTTLQVRSLRGSPTARL